MSHLRILRKVIEQRTQDRRTRSRCLPEQTIEIGQQPIAQFDIVTADPLDSFAIDPRFMRTTGDGGMGAHQRVEHTSLHPAGKQLGGSISRKAANIRPHKGHARQAEVTEHRQRLLQIFPARLIVARPDR